MANYNIIIDNNHFKPFSYKDIMAPYDDYAKDYDAEAERIHKFIDDYGNLNLPTGSNAYREYQDALDQQNKALESFYSQGLNQNTQKELFKAFTFNKGRLSKMKAAAAQVDKMRDAITALGQDAIIGTEIDNPHLIDDILEGKNPTLKHVDRTKVFTLGQQIGKGLQTSMTDHNVSTFTQALKDQYYLATIGDLKYDEILEAALSKLSDDVIEGAQNNPAVQALIKAYESYGNGFSKSGQQQIWDTIGLGVMSGLEPPKQQFMQDNNIANNIALQQENREQAKFQTDFMYNPATEQYELRPDGPTRTRLNNSANNNLNNKTQNSRYVKYINGNASIAQSHTSIMVNDRFLLEKLSEKYPNISNAKSVSLVSGELNKKQISTLMQDVIDKKNKLDEDELKDYTKNPNASDYTALNKSFNTLCDAIDKLGYIIDKGESYRINYSGGNNRVLPEDLGGGGT